MIKTYLFYPDTSKKAIQEGEGGRNISELEPPSLTDAREGKDAAPSTGKELHSQSTDTQLVNHCTFGVLK